MQTCEGLLERARARACVCATKKAPPIFPEELLVNSTVPVPLLLNDTGVLGVDLYPLADTVHRFGVEITHRHTFTFTQACPGSPRRLSTE